MDPHFIIPWVLGLLTALWFGWMAYAARRNRLFWAFGGGLFALVAATLLFGLGHAAAIPFSEAERIRQHLGWALGSIFLIVVLGWLFTAPLHPERLLPWKRRVTQI